MQNLYFQNDESYFRYFRKFVMQGEKPAAQTLLAHAKIKWNTFKIKLLIIKSITIYKWQKGLNPYVFLENPLFFRKIPIGFEQKKRPNLSAQKLFFYDFF